MRTVLPALIDKAGLQAELGITPYEADRIMRWLPTVRPAAKRIYVRRADVERHLEAATVEKSEPKHEHVGVSVWIRTRHLTACAKTEDDRARCTCQPRHTVEYRLGGRAAAKQNANTFRTLREAKLRRDLVAGWIAQGLNPCDQLAKLLTNSEPTSTLAYWFQAFINTRIDVTPKRLSAYRNARDRILPTDLGQLAPDQIRPLHVQEWIGSCADLSPGTIRQYVGILRQVLDHAELEPNPARSRKIRLPRETGEEPVPPSSREWQLIREHVSDEKKLLALRLIECLGLRISEAMQLTHADIDQHTSRIRVSSARTKGRTAGQRWLPVPAELLDGISALAGGSLTEGDHRVDSGAANVSRHAAQTGTATEAAPAASSYPAPSVSEQPAGRVFAGLTGQTVRWTLRHACTNAGVTHYSPHDLRHRRISLWVAHEFNLVTVRIWSGHTQLAMTNRYSHVMAEPHLDEWKTFWLDSYRAERLERRGVGVGPGPEGES